MFQLQSLYFSVQCVQVFSDFTGFCLPTWNKEINHYSRSNTMESEERMWRRWQQPELSSYKINSKYFCLATVL